MIRRSAAILAAYGLGSSSRSSSSVPARPNRSVIDTWMPHLASTAWIWALQLLRIPTSLARCRTSSRSSRVAGGAIHASGNLPIRSRSARSRASLSSFLTRRYSNALTPNGCARCTCAPRSRSASTAQYQPYVASSTTSGDSPARAITVDSISTSLLIRTHSNGSPSAVIRTITDRRRCRSIPTRSGGPAPSSHQDTLVIGDYPLITAILRTILPAPSYLSRARENGTCARFLAPIWHLRREVGTSRRTEV